MDHSPNLLNKRNLVAVNIIRRNYFTMFFKILNFYQQNFIVSFRIFVQYNNVKYD